MADSSFDVLIHAPQRLRICAILDTASHVDFGELQDRLSISKSALSKHLSQLEGADYVHSARVTSEGRSRLQFSFTEPGREKYHAHREELQRIMQAG